MSFPFKIPFAASGDQSTVPDSDLTGSVNFTEGYTPDYQADPSLDPNAKLIERDKFNFLMNKTTGAIGEIQRQGAADWYSDLAPYDLNAEVFYNGKRWRSTIANNSAVPESGPEWLDVTPGTAAAANVVQTTGSSTADVMTQKAVTDALNTKVGLTGNQTISGLKTFSQFPVTPSSAPTANYQVANKKYVDDALYLQPTTTGSITLNGTTNNTVTMTNIVPALELEVGDVIRINTGAYNKLHTVESITNNGSIIVNYEHAGNRGDGSLKLPNFTGTATVTRIAKWFNAPIGMGQAWVDVEALRPANTIITNSTGRSIQVNLNTLNGPSVLVDGLIVLQANSNYASAGQFIVQSGGTVQAPAYVSRFWRELR